MRGDPAQTSDIASKLPSSPPVALPKKKSFLRRLSLSASSASKAKASTAPLSAGAKDAVPPIAARYTQQGSGHGHGRSSTSNGHGALANGYGHEPGKGMALDSVPEVPQYVPPPALANGRYPPMKGAPPGQNGRMQEYGASHAGKGAQPVNGAYTNGGYGAPSGNAPAVRGGSLGSTARPMANGVSAAPRKSGSTPPVAVPTQELDRLAIRQAIQPVTPPSSPPKRGPIHPALASSPGGQPKQTNVTPYDMQVLGVQQGRNSIGPGMTRGSSGQDLAQQAQGRAPGRMPVQAALAAPPSVGGAAKPGLGIHIPAGQPPASVQHQGPQMSPSTNIPQRSPPRLLARAPSGENRSPNPLNTSPIRPSPHSPRSPNSPSSPSRLRQTSGPIPGAAAAHYPGQPLSATRTHTPSAAGHSPARVPLKAPIPVPAPGSIPPPAIMRQSSSFASSGGPTSPTYINSPSRQMDESPFHPKALNAIGAAERRMAPGTASMSSHGHASPVQGPNGLSPTTAMNARSLSSSITPVRRQSTEFRPPPPPAPPASAPPVRPRVEADLNPVMSEATKYALAIAGPKPSSPPQRRVSRPLPQPPVASPHSGHTARIPSTGIPPSNSNGSLNLPSFEFTKSPTLPDLVDPRKLAMMQKRPRPARLTFAYIVSIGRIQRNLLPYLGINSFLALLGTSDRVRKAFTGEMVGKWVLREWGIKLEGSKGKSWPNLTVWEGFLESQLHDPSTYATYPAQWHKLLQHLCLSYSLIVLYLRSLPESCFPQIEEEEERPVSRADVPLRNDRLVEIVMPSPLSGAGSSSTGTQVGSSITRSPSKLQSSPPSISNATFPRRRGATGPPISYPTPKRYNFSSNGSIRTRRSSDSRPGSVFSYQSTPSIAPSVPRHRLIRDSVASDPGQVMNARRFGSPAPRRIEPVFDKPPPYLVGKAAVLRVFVPLSEKVPRWPSAEGAFWVVKEMEKCGAMRKLRLGDLIANTAIKQPRATEHILVYVPGVKHHVIPLEYLKTPAGHLPTYIDALTLPPLYHYPLLTPIIVFPNLARFAPLAMSSVRLAYDHKDVLVSTGRASAKRCIHVTGFEVPPEAYEHGVATEWTIITLEAEGTGEGRAELERRLGYGDPARVGREAWEVVREKSIGTVWLRAV